ncbi:hypothetical protein COO91_06556 [Nostoc flagelliforme CCNUN1]|uniref:Uncharacterized protein n=1 Tax=Nostoc flagelliforme CCNUN1 TaxID=2038116 RepID=A0A2K8SYL6_9NOSO|nr:hypothetical protein [Nostoc flagelliforme]AUB40539.1 hypothetical protein COO91_06556 [Nostoc flagelliforme CCNUN1]
MAAEEIAELARKVVGDMITSKSNIVMGKSFSNLKEKILSQVDEL